MKKTILPLLLSLSILLSCSVTAFANDGLSIEELMGMSTDGGAALMDSGYAQCEYCGNWYAQGNEYRAHILNCPYDPTNTSPGNGIYNAPTSYVQCDRCGGWYMEGNEYRNHICTSVATPTPSSWSADDYYNNLLTGIPVAGSAALGTLYVNTTNGNSLNMRSRPNTDSYVVVSVPNGSAVTVYWYENSSWAYVYWAGFYGFCSTRYLSTYMPNSQPAPTPAPAASYSAPTSSSGSAVEKELKAMFKDFTNYDQYAAVKPFTPTGVVNLRWAPSTSAPVICVYSAGTVLRVIATNGAWCQVLNENTGVCGFISTTYLNPYLY